MIPDGEMLGDEWNYKLFHRQQSSFITKTREIRRLIKTQHCDSRCLVLTQCASMEYSLGNCNKMCTDATSHRSTGTLQLFHEMQQFV